MGPSSTTLLYGFKVSVATLDAFLVANNGDETFGNTPLGEHPDNNVSKLLLAKVARFDDKADKNKFRVVMPAIHPSDIATTAYITYSWVDVSATPDAMDREVKLEHDLPEPPKGFEELRAEILAFGDTVAAEKKVADEGKMGSHQAMDAARGDCQNPGLIQVMLIKHPQGPSRPGRRGTCLWRPFFLRRVSEESG
ncbi:hypothetical protein BT67DRAFT_431634 [Trichocladium antarcticum]|uniref:Uncharacterized protein n=1 Tax=Trichocladium antarcticum TaxID=1450529 RepID=A0AAN6ZGR5_9PEZI|nr:hypothetical protein BT67DRAFT_431634 [Trichocladium antarcticum]